MAILRPNQTNDNGFSPLDLPLAYLSANLSLIPVSPTGTKAPSIATWREYQRERPTEDMVREWYSRMPCPGIALICGGVSLGLELIDFDHLAEAIFPAWCKMVEAEWPGLLNRVSLVKTPRGYHCWLRCPDMHTPGNTVLASLSRDEQEAEKAAAKAENRKPSLRLIETRGEGGYGLVPGCPPSCHETHGLYTHHGGTPLHQLDTIGMDERDFLMSAARSFDRLLIAPEPPPAPKASPFRQGGARPDDLRPGDDFDRTGWDWADILTPHGWTLASGGEGGERRWRRPGKARGWSATTGHCTSGGSDLLRVFSTSANPFEEGKAYGKFRAVALLQFGGDLSKAASFLRGQGFGGGGTKAGKAAPQPEQAEKAKDGPPEEKRYSFLFDGEVIADGSPREILDSLGEGEEDETGRTLRVFQLCTIGAISMTSYPEPKWVVPGIMSEGLNILAGAPKQGKSIMALNLALTIAGGGLALGGVRVDVGDVLYLSLEDQFRRIKERSAKMLRVISPDLVGIVADRLTVSTEWPKMDEGGLRFLDLWATKAIRPTLIIIDVWNRFCPLQRGNASAYGQDADAMSRVKKFVEARGFSALVIHHTRKPGMKEPEDFVHEVSGTMGLSGAADGILVLNKSRNDVQASLCITGRDVAEQELIVEFDKETLTWKSLGTKHEHSCGRVKSKVVEYLKANRPNAFFPKDISEAVEEKPDAVRQVLHRLMEAKVVRKQGNAYAYPGECSGDEGVF